MNIELQTKKELDLLVRDVKRLSAAFRLFAVVVYLVFCIYKTVIKSGNPALNIVLLCLTAAYLVLVVFFTVNEAQSRLGKRVVSISGKVYRYVKLGALAFSAVLAVMGILTAKDHVTVISVLLAVFLPVCVVLQLILDVAVYYLTKRIERFETAFARDMEMLKRDIVKIAIDVVKESIFSRKGKREESADGTDEGLLIVGSDELGSLRSMKKVEDEAKPKKRGFFDFFKRKKKPARESAAETALSSTTDGEEKESSDKITKNSIK